MGLGQLGVFFIESIGILKVNQYIIHKADKLKQENILKPNF